MKKQITIMLCVILSVFLFAGCQEKVFEMPGADRTQIVQNIYGITDAIVGTVSEDGSDVITEAKNQDWYAEYLEYDRKQWGFKAEEFKENADLEFKSQNVFNNAVNSYIKAEPDAGKAIKLDINSLEIGYGKDGGYEVTIDLDCATRDVQMALSYNTEMQVTNAAFNVQYSIAENLQKAGLNTLLGMGTVFVILILISLIISLFGFFPKIEAAKKAKAAAKKVETPAAAPAPAVAAPVVEEELSDDLELVAVIAAAIASYEGSEDASGYVVRSIKKSKKWHNA